MLILQNCKPPNNIEEINNVGYAQGTTFNIKYLGEPNLEFKSQLDSLFVLVDNSMSTYQENSIISRVNCNKSFVQVDEHFLRVLNKSLELSKESKGLFDPSVGPIAELWGFGLSKREIVDSSMVDSLKNFVGFEKIEVKGDSVYLPKGMKIDFNAIAQGYTVDLIADFLMSKGIENYMVEVGGEVRAKGLNSKNQIWRIGIDKPEEEIDQNERFQAIINLENSSLATSGNYRKFWVDEKTGLKYSHTLNPKTGFPAKNQLLSVSIIAPTAMEADGYSTMCMVMGLNKSMKLVGSNSSLEGYFIFINEEGDLEEYISKGFKKNIIN